MIFRRGAYFHSVHRCFPKPYMQGKERSNICQIQRRIKIDVDVRQEGNDSSEFSACQFGLCWSKTLNSKYVTSFTKVFWLKVCNHPYIWFTMYRKRCLMIHFVSHFKSQHHHIQGMSCLFSNFAQEMREQIQKNNIFFKSLQQGAALDIKHAMDVCISHQNHKQRKTLCPIVCPNGNHFSQISSPDR